MFSTKFKNSTILILLLSIVFAFNANSQINNWNPDLVKDSNEALAKMIEDTPKLTSFKDKAYGYAVFPKVTKAGIGIGGAAGKGVVYKNHEIVGSSKLKQASFGLQLGGEQYGEVIFFENQESFDNFINGNLKFDAQASAVAITAGASVDVAYQDGVAVFTRTLGGLMYQASIGGQHFKFEPIDQ